MERSADSARTGTVTARWRIFSLELACFGYWLLMRSICVCFSFEEEFGIGVGVATGSFVGTISISSEDDEDETVPLRGLIKRYILKSL